MRIWISGCGGMMGSHLSGALAAAGHEVLASYYKPTVDPADLADLPLEEVDIRDWCSVYDSLTRVPPAPGNRHPRLVFGVRFADALPPRRRVSSGGTELPGGVVAAADRDPGNQ